LPAHPASADPLRSPPIGRFRRGAGDHGLRAAAAGVVRSPIVVDTLLDNARRRSQP
jgi:hypothetical protein